MNLTELIKESKYIVAFTGAGVSVESGIPDFRSSGGLYTSGEFEGMNPEMILTRKTFRTNPKLLLKFYKERLMHMVDKEPNRTHIALKQLEDMGKLKFIITQNIDNLHKKCGSKNVLEIHGNGTRFKCSIECGLTYTYEEFLDMLEKDPNPKCKCEFASIRPDVVLFDEALNDGIFEKAYEETKKCDLMIAMGSSLIVRPACTLLEEIPDTAKLVIINKESTYYDRRADLVIRENCGGIMELVMKTL